MQAVTRGIVSDDKYLEIFHCVFQCLDSVS